MINSTNYHSTEINKQYMSYSQFKTFYSDCPARAIAEMNGEWTTEPSDAMLQGSYIDAYVEGTLDSFIAKHPEIVSSRGPSKGQLKSQFSICDDMIRRMSMDNFFTGYLEGEKQVVLTGDISGVPFKGKLDILAKDRIVDFKTVRDFSPVWSADKGERVTFVEAMGYDIQGAIYRELYRQKTGEVLPYYIAAVTKEKEPDLAIIEIPEKLLDETLEKIIYYAPKYQMMKAGLMDIPRCEKCDYCKHTKVLHEPISLYDFGDFYGY